MRAGTRTEYYYCYLAKSRDEDQGYPIGPFGYGSIDHRSSRRTGEWKEGMKNQTGQTREKLPLRTDASWLDLAGAAGELAA